MTLQPYSEYKDSGVPWLGDVPTHWEVRRAKTVLQEVDRRSSTGDGPLLSMTRTRGIVRHAEITEKLHSAATLVGYKVCLPHEVVMNRMQAWSGMFHVAPETGLSVQTTLCSHHSTVPIHIFWVNFFALQRWLASSTPSRRELGPVS